MHGGSGISEKDFKHAIRLGINKINFFTGMSQTALKTTEEFFDQDLVNYNAYVDLNMKVKDSVKEVVKDQMRIFGSINRIK